MSDEPEPEIPEDADGPEGEKPTTTGKTNKHNRRNEKVKEHIPSVEKVNAKVNEIMEQQKSKPAAEFRDLVAAAIIEVYESFADYISWEIKVLATEEALSEIDSIDYIKGEEYNQVEAMLDRIHGHVVEVYKRLFKRRYNYTMEHMENMNKRMLMNKQGFMSRTVDHLGNAGKKITKGVTIGVVDLQRRRL